ncbi:hypothetical protein L1987_11802 [Smallanthus sonchifolius]|uniref:Uncharacterized protein n=1 Tax=Smallanthus sonchifolius TaxID=185202 RepID=A0ACB9JEM7_9ASTR|nr:hypothetical protein L1987_11802 [Smallanthus sonchifolius]
MEARSCPLLGTAVPSLQTLGTVAPTSCTTAPSQNSWHNRALTPHGRVSPHESEQPYFLDQRDPMEAPNRSTLCHTVVLRPRHDRAFVRVFKSNLSCRSCMFSTPVEEVPEPSLEPKRDLHRRLRAHFRFVARLLEFDEVVVDEFDGKDHEDPNTHLGGFLEICATFKIRDATDDVIQLRLFPFSLRDRAKAWLLSLPPRSINTWDQMAAKFIEKYFPPEKTTKLRARILSFQQDDGETIYEAWERFKELTRKVPHHGLLKWKQCETFYNGLDMTGKQLIDAYTVETLERRHPRRRMTC